MLISGIHRYNKMVQKQALGQNRNIIVVAFLFHACFVNPVQIEFSRNFVGVTFRPFVKIPEDGHTIPSLDEYTFENIRTMLEVVSSKFSKVVIADFAPHNTDISSNSSNTSRNTKTSVVVQSPRAAAILNRNNKKDLKLLLQVHFDDYIPLALEVSAEANKIHPETVNGIVVYAHETKNYLQELLDSIMLARQNVIFFKAKLRIGVQVSCFDLLSKKNNTSAKIAKQILLEIDIVICKTDATNLNPKEGAIKTIQKIFDDWLNYRQQMLSINPNLDVSGITQWSSMGYNSWENLEEFENYRKAASEWSLKQNFMIYMMEAFDIIDMNPASGSAHLGWWRLEAGSMINAKMCYREKVSGLLTAEPGSSLTAKVGIIAAACVLTLIIAGFVCVCLRIHQLKKPVDYKIIRDFIYGNEQSSAGGLSAYQTMDIAVQQPYNVFCEIAKEKITIDKETLLGTGHFGFVYRAKLERPQGCIFVALKMTKGCCCKHALKSLLSEIKILTYLGKHPNIVAMEGAYTMELYKGIVYVATELCSLGSLEKYLRNYMTECFYVDTHINQISQCKTYENDLTKIMLQWSLEIARGMEYLESKHVVHADLATRNVLLTANKIAKITDFGLSRKMYHYQKYTKKNHGPLPWRSMAIESLKRSEFSSKSDIWSYGVTLWEIFSMGDTPYPGLAWNSEFVTRLVEGLRMKRPHHATPEIYSIMLACWQADPNLRPCFSSLKEKISILII